MNLRNTIKNIAINENMQFEGEEGEPTSNKMEISQLLRKHFEMMLKNPEYKKRHDQMSQMLQIGTDQNMMPQQGQGQQPPMGGGMPPIPGMGGGSPMGGQGGGMPPMPRMGGQQQGQGQQPPKDPFMQMAFGNRGGQQGQPSPMGGMPPMPRMGGGSPMGGQGGGMPPMPPDEDQFGAEFSQGMEQQPPMGGMMGMRRRPPMF